MIRKAGLYLVKWLIIYLTFYKHQYAIEAIPSLINTSKASLTYVHPPTLANPLPFRSTYSTHVHDTTHLVICTHVPTYITVLELWTKT